MPTRDLMKYPQDLVDAVGEAIAPAAGSVSARRPTAREVLVSLESAGWEVRRTASAGLGASREAAATPGPSGRSGDLSGLMDSLDARISAARQDRDRPADQKRRESA